MLLKMLGIAVAIMTIAGVALSQAAGPRTDEANVAVTYIESLQNADGGFPAFGTDSSPSASLDAAIALVAAGVDAAAVSSNGGATLGEYLSSQAPPDDDPGAVAKLSFGLSAIGLDGGAYVAQMRGFITPGTDAYGDDLFDEAFYVFSLVAADEPSPASAAYLRSVQLADGGWEFAEGFGSDSNTTAIVLQALLAAGGLHDENATREAIEYLAAVQNDDGGFGFTASDDSDPNSTALVIQALVAAGEDVDAGGPWAQGGSAPLDGLLSFFNSNSGAFQFAGEDSPFATYQAVPALMLAPFPDLETAADVEPAPQASPSAEPDLVAPATATPPLGLPPTGSGPSSALPLLPLIVSLVLLGGSTGVLAAAKAGRRD